MAKRSFEDDILSKFQKNNSTGETGGISAKRADRNYERDLAEMRRREYNEKYGRSRRTSTFENQIQNWGFDGSYTEAEERRRRFWESTQKKTRSAPEMTDNIYASGKRRFDTNHEAKDSKTQQEYIDSAKERKKEVDRHLRGLMGSNLSEQEREKWQTESDSLAKQIRQGERRYDTLKGQEYAEKYKEAQKEDNSDILKKKWEAQELRKQAKQIVGEINKTMQESGGQASSYNGIYEKTDVSEKEKQLNEVNKRIRLLEGETGSRYMTDDETKTYNKILREEGKEEAQAYEKYMQETLNQREGEEIADNVIKNGGIDKAVYSAVAGLDQFKSGMQQAFSDEELPVSKYQFASAKVRDSIDTAKIAGYDVGQALYDLGTTTFNMVPSIAATAVTGAIGGSAALASIVGVGSMSISAKGNAYKQALQEGYEPAQAQNYSTMIGILEGGLQYALGGVGKLGGKVSGNMIEMATKNIESVAGRIAAELGGRMLAEGTEEYLQDILNPVVRNIAFDENNELKLFTADALYSGILGALSAGVLDGGSVALNTRTEGRIGNEVLNTEDASQSLVDTALAMDEDTDAYKMASKMKAGKLKETKVNMGQLYRNTSDAVMRDRYQMDNAEIQETTGENDLIQEAVEEQDGITEGYMFPEPDTVRDGVVTQEMFSGNIVEESAGEEKGNVQEMTDRTRRSAENVDGTQEAKKYSNDDNKTVDGRNKQEYTWNIQARTNTGEDITVKGLEKTDKGTYAVVDTGRGMQNLPLSEVWTRDYRIQDVLDKAVEYGNNGAKNIVANYNPEIDTKTYTRGFDAYYNAALVNLPYDKVNSMAASYLPESVRRQAYFAGQNDRAESMAKTVQKAKGKGGLVESKASSKLSNEMRTLLDLYGKASGAGIIVEETIAEGKANGYYDSNGNIHVALDAENPLNVVANHELTHYIKQNAPENYRAYRDFVMQYFKENYGTSTDELIKKHIDSYERQGINITKEEAMDEIVANASEMFLTDEAAIKKLAKENPTLGEKILGFIRDLVKKIKKMMRDVSPSSQEAQMLNVELETAQKAERLWLDALSEAGKINDNAVNRNQSEDKDIPEIRFSLKDTGESSYIRDGAEHQKMTDLLEQRLREYRHIEPDRRSAEITAKNILKKYKSKYSKDQLTEELTTIMGYVANNQDVSGNEAMQIASGIAKKVLEKSGGMNRELTEQYKDMRKGIRNTTIKVDPQTKAEIEYMEGYENFRKRNMGSLRLSTEKGIAVDTYFEELATEYPELFKKNEIYETGGQLMAISDAMQMTKPFYENPYGMNMEESQRDLAYEMYDTYFNVKPVKTSITAERNRLNRLQAEYRTKKEQLRREYQEKYKEQQKKYESELEKVKEKYQGQQGKVAQALAKQRAAYEEARRTREEGKQATRLRQNIKKNGMELSKWIIEPTDQKHIPEQLRKPLLQFLTQIDFTNARAQIDSQTSMSLRETMMSLNNALKKLEAAQNDNGYTGYEMDIDSDAIVALDRLIEENTGIRSLSELGLKELEQLNDAMTGIKYGITRANKMIANSRYANVSECAEGTINNLKGKKDIKKEGKVNRMLNLDMTDSRSYFEQFGESGMSVYREIRKGFDKRTWDIERSQEYMMKLKEQEGISKKQMNEWTGDNAKGQRFNIGGQEFDMTKAQIMSLYLSMLRPQARHHIETGGFRVQETKMKLTGGDKVTGFTQTVKESPVIRLNGAQIAEITDTLTEQEKNFAMGMQKFLAEECANWGNETSMLLYGYRKFNDPDYFPIKTDSNQIRTNDKTVETASLYAIRNQGMTKKTVKNANNAIQIADVFDVFTKHVMDMANYHGYAVPLSDAMKWFNYTQRNEDGIIQDGVKSQMQRVYGKGANEYFVKLMQDINGAAYKGEESVYGSGFMGNYKAAAVGANIRVVLQQPTAIARAWAVMDAKYLLQGVWTPAAGREVKEHSAIALWKSWGYFETMVGKSMKEVITGQSNIPDKIKNMSMAPAGWADDITWGGIWNACRAEIKDTRPELEVNSEEFYQAVADRFDDVIDQTQVVDTTLHRTQFMREKGALAKMQSAFMAEPSKTWNVLRNAYKSGDKGRMVKTATAYVVTAALTSVAAGVMDAFRDDDEYKKWMEKWMDASKRNMEDNVNPMNLFPFVKDAYPYIALGGMTAAEMAASSAGDQKLAEQIGDFREEYESKIFAAGRMDMEFFEQIQSFCQAVTSGKKNKWEKFVSGAALVSMATGIPIKNIARDSEAVIGTIAGKRLGNSPNENSDRIKMLYDALNGGTEEDRKRYREDILNNGGDEEYIVNSTSKIYTANIKDYLAAGDVKSANEEIDGLYNFKKSNGMDDKKIISSLKSSITSVYKDKVLSGDEKAKEMLKKIKVNGEVLYTEKDFERWEKRGEKE